MLRYLVMAGAVSLAMVAVPVAAEMPATITVTGEGQSAAPPDMAEISLGVRMTAPTALEAVDRTSAALGAVLQRLEAMGIAARDMQTEALALNQIWDRRTATGEARPGSFEASNTLSVRVRDLDRLGEILQAALSDGANALSGLRFGFIDPGPVQDAARRAAVADAMARARLYAEAAGVRLGPVLSISEGAARSSPVTRGGEMRAMAMASLPVATGESEVSAQVTMVFAIATD